MSQHDDDDEEGLPHPEKKGETWLMTFADMMSLLMSFFVLLLSFSEQDSAKFKQVGGSLEKAFGVQTEVPAFDAVKGTSIISDKFSAGKPDPTDQNEVRQKTSNEISNNLKVNKRIKTDDHNMTLLPEKFKFKASDGDSQVGADQKAKEKYQQEQAKKMTDELTKTLAPEIAQHKIEVALKKNAVTIRILEKAYFNSGEDSLKPSFIPLLEKLSPLLDKFPGKIIVSGHTDNVPISNARFRSNWDLSAARAATTLHYLNETSHIDNAKMVITGYADTRPLTENNSDENRSRNRRVEITLLQGENPLFDEEQQNKVK